MMKFIDKFNTIIHKPFFSKYSTLMGLWALLGVIAWITKYFPGKYNNFSIFRQSFWHTLNELPLYAAYPEEYNDIFHYGPVFSLVVAPFAITPLWLGLLTWSVAQSFSYSGRSRCYRGSSGNVSLSIGSVPTSCLPRFSCRNLISVSPLSLSSPTH